MRILHTKGNGRRPPPPQSAPMGSRLAVFLLSVRAYGSNQGEGGLKAVQSAFCGHQSGRYKEHPGGSVSRCAKELGISRPTARKWMPEPIRQERLKTAAEQLQAKQQPGKLKRIWNIIKE